MSLKNKGRDTRDLLHMEKSEKAGVYKSRRLALEETNQVGAMILGL